MREFCRTLLLLIFVFQIICVDNEIVVVNEAIGRSTTQDNVARVATEQKSEWLFLVYMAADNNLHYFAWSNIKQMAAVGSNNNIKIVVQLSEPGANKQTQRYLVEQNKAVLLNQDQVAAGIKCDSGSPKTLIDFCVDSINRFPAQHVALIFWNHGTGYLDPVRARVLNVSDLFQLNPENMMLELNRSEDFLDKVDSSVRAICFDETHHSFLSNQKVSYALQEICKKLGRKIDVIGLDACMMQMLEFGALVQPYAHLMVASQEVELGAGWNYKHVLAPFAERSLDPVDLSRHIVTSYHRVYSRITTDYTLSAVNLDALAALERTINNIGSLLTTCLTKQINRSVKNTLIKCRSKRFCTYFDEPSYVDLGHLLKNILSNISQFAVRDDTEVIEAVKVEIKKALDAIAVIVLANVTGKSLTQATGLSIYFPENRVHASYPNTPFASANLWSHMIHKFVAS